MAYDIEITAISKKSKEKTTELLAFAVGLTGLTCRQHEALVHIIEQIISLEAQGDHTGIAQLLGDAPALLRQSSTSN